VSKKFNNTLNKNILRNKLEKKSLVTIKSDVILSNYDCFMHYGSNFV